MNPQETPPIEVNSTNTDQLLEHILQNGDNNAQNTNQILEHLLVQSSKEDTQTPILEHQLVKLDEIAQNIKPTEISDGMLFHVKGVKGDKGDKGDKGEDSIVPGPTGPQGPAGKNGESIVGPQGPTGPKGPAGKNGLDGDSIVGPRGPAGQNGKNGKDAILPDISVIAETISPLIDFSKIKNTPNFGVRGTGYLREITDVDTTGLSNGQSIRWNSTTNKWEVFTPFSGGGVGTPTSPTSGAINGSNTTFTFTTKPTLLIIDGTIFRENFGWTWSGSTATTDNPPAFDIFSI